MSNCDGFWSIIRNFFCNENHFISNLASIAGAIALIFTVVQIMEAKNQIIANTSYQIHKDGRAIVKDIDPEIAPVFSEDAEIKNFSEKIISKAKKKADEIVRFFASVYRLYKYGNIPDQEWEIIEEELCSSLSHKEIFKEYWETVIQDNKKWSKDFRDNFQKCLDK